MEYLPPLEGKVSNWFHLFKNNKVNDYLEIRKLVNEITNNYTVDGDMASEIFKEYTKWKNKRERDLIDDNLDKCKHELKRILNLKTKKNRKNFMNGAKLAFSLLPPDEQNKLWDEYNQQWQNKVQPETSDIEQMIINEQKAIDRLNITVNLKTFPKDLTLAGFITHIFGTKKQLVIDYSNEFIIDGRTIDDLYDEYLQLHPPSKKKIYRDIKPKVKVQGTESYAHDAFPFKSKIKAFETMHNVQIENKNIPDHHLTIKNNLQRPSFSPKMNSWQIDYVFAKDPTTDITIQRYLFCINVNTKFLVVYPTKSKSEFATLDSLKKLIKSYPVVDISGDGEYSFTSKMLINFYKRNNINTYFQSSKFTYHNKVVDAVIKTIRNAFGNDWKSFGNPIKMKEMVDLYNNTPHKAYDNKYSPLQVQNDPEIEGQYIRYQQSKLKMVLLNQKLNGLHEFKNGNILLIHLDRSKTMHKMEKRRRNFDELAVFIKYINGNVQCKLLNPYPDINTIEIPIYFCKKIAENINSIPNHYKSLL